MSGGGVVTELSNAREVCAYFLVGPGGFKTSELSRGFDVRESVRVWWSCSQS